MKYRIYAVVDIDENDPIMAEQMVDDCLEAAGWKPQRVRADKREEETNGTTERHAGGNTLSRNV